MKALLRMRTLALLALFFGALCLSFHASTPVFAIDEDGDGLTAEMEMHLNTSDSNTDSDNDSVDDWSEAYLLGTDPSMPDTDNDSQDDGTDADPLDDGDSAGGETTPNLNYSATLAHSSLTGTTPMEGIGVNAISGELELVLASIDLGPGYVERNTLTLYYLSGVDLNGPWGWGVMSSWDFWIVEQQDDDVEVYMFGRKFEVDEDAGTYTSPAGFPFTVTKDGGEDEIYVTAIKGGKTWTFDATDGWLLAIADRFGNTTTINRSSGVIQTVDLPEGNEVTLDTYGSGRYSTITDWATSEREWSLTYNYCDELAKMTDPEGSTTQFFYLNVSGTLDKNLVRIKLPAGQDRVLVEYDTFERVSKQTVGENELTLSYASGETTVTDFAGNQRKWTFTPGARVPNSLVVYSNRDVRATDPASWTTTFGHDANELRNKVVHPEGDRIDYEWNAQYCLTEIRHKATDTDTDDNNANLVQTFTYGSTYHQLEDSTDPNGNTTERTLNGDEQVTTITWPTITHKDPDQTITESNTWNGNGQILTNTDGEGVVTKYEYYTSGAKKGLLWKVTKDYGTGKLNLVTEYDYNEYRFLVSETDPDDDEWTFTTDKLGRRETSTSPSPQGYETVTTYDANGWVTSVDVENVDETNTRDTTNPWWTTSYGYDDLGQVISKVEEISDNGTTEVTRETAYEFDGNGNLVLVTLPMGNETHNVYDERGLLYSRTRGYGASEPDPATEYYDYDGNGNLVERTDGRGKDWTKTYDDFDRLETEVTPLGNYVEYTRDKNGNVTETESRNSSDDLLAATRTWYDEMNRVYEEERWLDDNEDGDWDSGEEVLTTYDLDKRGLVVEIIDPMNHSTYITYDNARRKTEWEDHLGNKIQDGFSGDGWTATEIVEVAKKPTTGTESFVTEIVLDPLNRVTERRIVDRDNSSNKHVWQYKYTSLNVLVEIENPDGNKTYFEHDGLAQVTAKVVDLGGGSEIETLYGFDLNGNLVTLTDDAGNVTSFAYNARDIRTEIENDDESTREFTILDDDGIGGWTDENGTVVTNTHDNDGHLLARSISKAQGVLGPSSETYAYDGLGRLTEAKNGDATVQCEYDTLSRLVAETQGPDPIGQNGKTIQYAYIDDGSRTQTTYFSGYEINYTVDAVGRWTLIEDASSNDLVAWTYYGPHRRTGTVSYLNGTTTENTYDGFRQVTDIAHKTNTPTTFAGFSYAYDDVGNPLYEARSHDSNKGDMYAYDMASRLTAALIGESDPAANVGQPWGGLTYDQRLDYDLDDDSNRESVTTALPLPDTTYYTTNNLNQYTEIGGASRDHDDNGNLIVDGTRTFGYDFRNNLVSVDDGQTTLMTAEFDALGRRTKKTTNEGALVLRYFYDGEHVVEEYDDEDELIRKFVYGQQLDKIHLMIAKDRADVDGDENTTEALSFYCHANMLGSVSHVTGEEGNLVEQYNYTPYGQPTFKDSQGSDLSGQSAIGNPYLFTGRRYEEESAQFHFRRRCYDPQIGRFLQRDPLRETTTALEYDYAHCAPLSWLDPNGETAIRAECVSAPWHAEGNVRGRAMGVSQPVWCWCTDNSCPLAWDAGWRYHVDGIPSGNESARDPFFVAMILHVNTSLLGRNNNLIGMKLWRTSELFPILNNGATNTDWHMDRWPRDPVFTIVSRVRAILRVAKVTNRRAAFQFIPVSQRVGGSHGRAQNVGYVNQNRPPDDDVEVGFDLSYGQVLFGYNARITHPPDDPYVDAAVSNVSRDPRDPEGPIRGPGTVTEPPGPGTSRNEMDEDESWSGPTSRQ